ncbi:MAG: ankyrin repeat domain-containing protein [Burkholderiaceae bacterium]
MQNEMLVDYNQLQAASANVLTATGTENIEDLIRRALDFSVDEPSAEQQDAFALLCQTIANGDIDPNANYGLRSHQARDTLLSYVCRFPVEQGNFLKKCVACLIALGAAPDQPCGTGFSPLHIAANYNNVCVIESLLAHGASIEGRNPPNCFTPLHVAVVNGHRDALCTLLRHGADLHRAADNGYYPLHMAAQYGHTLITEILFAHGAKLQDTTHSSKDITVSVAGLTALHIAAFSGHPELVRLLLTRGGNPFVKSQGGDLPLHLAASTNQTECIAVLVKHSPLSIEERNILNYTPLHCAAATNSAASIDMLVSLKANLNAGSIHGETPLHVACANRLHDALQALLQHGAQPNVRTNFGRSPLHIAVEMADTKAVDLLLAAAAAPDSLDDKHQSPLGLAACKGYYRILDRLLACQSAVNLN